MGNVRDIRRDGICNPVAYVLCIGADFKRFGRVAEAGYARHTHGAAIIGTQCEEGGLEPVFIHGQAMSILASELAPFFEQDDRKLSKSKTKDIAIAKAARDILFDEFRNPPSSQNSQNAWARVDS